ncbi:MAG: restriction endonuclease subunit S [Lachnospiraceae bacterium]|nr:restriction endonuclease subunit S [Lachnospiraceae bacterium]
MNNQYPVLTSSKTGLYLQSNYFNKQVASQDNKGYKIIRRGQFTYRAMSDTGEFFPNMLECTDVGIVSPAYPVFEISRPEVILSEYLKYYFKSSSFQQSIASFAQGSTRTSVKFAKMKTVSLDLPSIEQQKTVVKVLDKTKRIIDDREALLKGLDNLIKARFVEMFGSIKSNDKGWNTVQLKDIADVRGRVGWKGYKKEDLRESGPLVLGATHLTDSGELDLSAPVYLSREKYEESPEIVLQKNDLIFTQRGNTIGKVGLVAEDIGEATVVYPKAEKKETIFVEATDNVAKHIDSTEKKSRFRFSEVGIPVGSELEFINNKAIKVTVADDTHILYKGEQWSMSKLARVLLKRNSPVQGTLCFSYNGKRLTDLRGEFEDN